MLTLSAPATDAGMRDLLAEAEALNARWFGGSPVAVSKPVPSTHDVVTLHGQLKAGTRSREALELLPAETAGGLTPKELGQKMRPQKSGAAVPKASARAAIRVIQRVSGDLIKKGVIAEQIVKVDFEKYDLEGAGRYSVSDDARKALDQHLKKKSI